MECINNAEKTDKEEERVECMKFYFIRNPHLLPLVFTPTVVSSFSFYWSCSSSCFFFCFFCISGICCVSRICTQIHTCTVSFHCCKGTLWAVVGDVFWRASVSETHLASLFWSMSLGNPCSCAISHHLEPSFPLKKYFPPKLKFCHFPYTVGHRISELKNKAYEIHLFNFTYITNTFTYLCTYIKCVKISCTCTFGILNRHT